MHYPTLHPLLDARTRSTLEAELAQAARNPKLCPLMKRAPDLWPGLVRCYLQLARLPRKLRRQLQRRWKRSLAALALLLALGQAPALAADIFVTTTDPDIDGTDGACSLIQAIDNANNDALTHSDCPAGSGPDTIDLSLATGTHTLTAVNNNFINGDTGLPVIASTITIEGYGSTITRGAGAPDFRIIGVNSSGNLTLNQTKVSGGVNSFTTPGFTPGGGGVLNYYGTLTLTHSTVSGNSAISNGGGIYNRLGTATLTNSTVSGNSASFGGGVEHLGGTLTLINSTVSGNSSGGSYGGGMILYSGTVTLSRSLISGNTDPTGVEEVLEVYNYGGTSTVTADDYNLFGHDGASGVSGFTPGATDSSRP